VAQLADALPLWLWRILVIVIALIAALVVHRLVMALTRRAFDRTAASQRSCTSG
jgi:hypothetical protein